MKPIYLLFGNWGIIVRKDSAWVGVHYSDYNKRYCMNLLPFCTIWWITEGGKIPSNPNERVEEEKGCQHEYTYQVGFTNLDKCCDCGGLFTSNR